MTNTKGIRKEVGLKIKEKLNVVATDPDDNKGLECAIASQADLIVSSDQDLVKLKRFRKIGIVHPRALAWTFPGYFRKK